MIDSNEDLCELEGDGPVFHAEINLLLRRVRAYHLNPMKKLLAETAKSVSDHQSESALRDAKIAGGLFVLKIMGTVALTLLGAILAVLAKRYGLA